MNYNTYAGSLQEKIMFVIEDVLGATSQEKAVDLRTVVDTGIAMGIWEDYPRGSEDGHPVWPCVSVMCGIGSDTAVMNNEEPSLHRGYMRRDGNKRLFYWVDRTHEHEIVFQGDECIEDDGKKSTRTIPRIQIDRTINPEIAEKAKAYLKERHNLVRPIPYLLDAVNGHHTVTVHIVKNRFFTFPLDSQNPDKNLGLIPYCVDHPAMAESTIKGTQLIRSWKLYDKWAEVSK